MKNLPWYGYLILGIILTAIVYFVYLKPKNAELKSLKADRIKAEQAVDKLHLKKKQLDKIEAELANLNKSLSELEEFIPQKKEISEILRNIQQIAYDCQLDILKFTPQKEVNKEFYSEWPIPIEIRGSYHNLGSFFDEITHFPRIFNIDEFSVKSLARQTDEFTISALFTAKTYFLLEESLIKPKPLPKGKRPARKKDETY